MSGITVGQPWAAGSFKDLRIAGYANDDAHLAALTVVVNGTRGTAWSAEQVARFYGHPAFELERDARLVWRGATPLAAAICYPLIHFADRAPGNFEIFVVPEARQHGLGSRLLAHLETAAQARGHHVLETTVDQRDALGRGFLLAHGFRAVGQTAHLVRPTPAGPRDGAGQPPALPPGFAIASLAADPDAGERYRDLANRLGAYDPGYTLLEPDEPSAASAGPTPDAAGIFVLSDPHGREVGVIRASSAGRGQGYLHEIRIDPAYRGRNLSTALVSTALAYLAARGVTATALDTTGPDTPAYRLATRCGFAEAHRWQQLLKPLAGGRELSGWAGESGTCSC